MTPASRTPVPAAVDPDRDARRNLARHRGFAIVLLLLLMAVLTVATYRTPPGVYTEVLQAAAKAGVVGGIADWLVTLR